MTATDNIPQSAVNPQPHDKNSENFTENHDSNDQMTQSVNGQMTRQEFLAWESASRDTIDFKRSYVDLAGGDLIAGLLLSQIVYWHLPAKNGRETKLMVEHDGHLWLAKTRGAWWDECRIRPKQYDRAAGVLESLGIIETRTMRYAGDPTQHTRVCWDVFLRDLALITMPVAGGNNDIPQRARTIFPKGQERDAQKGRTKSPSREKRCAPNGNIDIDDSGKSLTETLTQTTAQSPAENTSKNTTTTPTSTARSGVGEPEKNVVDIFDLLDKEEEVQDWQDDDDPEDVFCNKNVSQKQSQKDDTPDPGASSPPPSALELAAQAVEDSLIVSAKAVQKAIQAMRSAGDSDDQIACVLKESRERVEARRDKGLIKSSAGGWWVESVDGVAAEIRSDALRAKQRKEAAKKARQAHAESAAQRREREETQRSDQETDRAARREKVLSQSDELLISAFAAARKNKPAIAYKFKFSDEDSGGRELIQKMVWPTFLEMEREVNAILNQGAPA